MKKIIAIACIVGCIGMLAGCGNTTNKDDKKETTTIIETVAPPTNEQGSSIPVVTADTKKVNDTTKANKKSKKNKETTQKEVKHKKTKAKGGNIVGSWTFEGGIFVYTFKKDGSGVFTTGSDAKHFTYKTNGNKVILKYKEGGSVTMPYTVQGKTLFLKDENGDDMPYHKNKPHKNPNN